MSKRDCLRTQFRDEVWVAPQMLTIAGEYEWVEDVVSFGDLIEKYMGTDASSFYFDQLNERLKQNKELKGGIIRGGKPRQGFRGDCKRLF